jgi:hypothetical protein
MRLGRCRWRQVMPLDAYPFNPFRLGAGPFRQATGGVDSRNSRLPSITLFVSANCGRANKRRFRAGFTNRRQATC